LGTGSQTSLNKAIGKSPSTIQYHLNTLKQAGFLVTKGKLPTTKYYTKRGEDIGEKKYLQIKLVALLNFMCIKRKAFRYAGHIS
jgi:DNA-binding transcriptional ArsR family regulator